MINAIQSINTIFYEIPEIVLLGRFRKFFYENNVNWIFEANVEDKFYSNVEIIDEKMRQELLYNKLYMGDPNYLKIVRLIEVLENCIFPLGILIAFASNKFLPQRPEKFFSHANRIYLTSKMGCIFAASVVSYMIANTFFFDSKNVEHAYDPNFLHIILDLIVTSGMVEIACEVMARLPFDKLRKGYALTCGALLLMRDGITKI